MTNRRKLEKRLRYRDQAGASEAAHRAHWEGFTYQGGPVVVCLQGSWGKPRVFASSEAEGRRVLSHAASIAGWDLSPGSGAVWLVGSVSGGRLGRSGTFGVKVRRGVAFVSKREGSSGAPNA